VKAGSSGHGAKADFQRCKNRRQSVGLSTTSTTLSRHASALESFEHKKKKWDLWNQIKAHLDPNIDLENANTRKA
jgi:hypothetical protein